MEEAKKTTKPPSEEGYYWAWYIGDNEPCLVEYIGIVGEVSVGYDEKKWSEFSHFTDRPIRPPKEE